MSIDLKGTGGGGGGGGSTTYTVVITVQVTDSGTPPQTNTATFTIYYQD
jgi:hypothetical protein